MKAAIWALLAALFFGLPPGHHPVGQLGPDDLVPITGPVPGPWRLP